LNNLAPIQSADRESLEQALMASAAPYTQALDKVIADVIGPAAMEVDKNAAFPRAAMDALAKAGLLGLISAKEVGGMGEGMRAASAVVEKIAEVCGSTAMVTAMHYSGAAVIEKFGAMPVRKEIAAGRHLTTLAFSEAGSRSHFWAPVSTATKANGAIVLDGMKSWITSARYRLRFDFRYRRAQ
jgi:alkylation response protein AidB-like acyl-CoA dehydrogenase